MKSFAEKILVVGTTADYIELLDDRFPGDVVFMTDPEERAQWPGRAPVIEKEILVSLKDNDGALRALEKHLDHWKISLCGIVSYDCESLILASMIAERFSLPFSTLSAVRNCRSKYVSKKLWHRCGVSCPKIAIAHCEDEVAASFKECLRLAVMKPLSGSGGELVFLARTLKEAEAAFHLIQERLRQHVNERMYGDLGRFQEEDPRRAVVMEEYIGGEEYSVDFILKAGRAGILRLTKKIVSDGSDFGTILAYELTDRLPAGWSCERLSRHLVIAAESLGLVSAVVMADFKFYQGQIYFLELTPRLGGDCLLPLIKAGCGLDMLKVSLDFARGQAISIPESRHWKHFIGLQLFARQAGRIDSIDAEALRGDPRTICCHLKRRPGDMIQLPPQDYDRRVLGYAVFDPEPDRDIKQQCRELSEKLVVTIK